MKNIIKQIIKEELQKLNEKDPNEYDANVLISEISEIANDVNQPKPTKKLDTGSNAMVFETTNPNIIIRAELIDEGEESYDLGEYTLADEDIQNTGGVSKIFYIGEHTINNGQYLITWKEKINENFEYIIYQKYNDEQASEILYALHLYNLIYGASSEQRNKQLAVLKRTKETSKLYNAIMAGLPVGDLAPGSNMGVNSKGYIVAFDV